MKSTLRVPELSFACQTRHNSERGYVLYEALLSVVILSIGIMALLEVSQKSIRGVQGSLTHGAARQLAESVLSELEIAALYDVRPDGILMNSGQANVKYQVQRQEWPAAVGVEEVSVTVSWNDRGKPGSITLTTLLPKPKGRR